MISKWPSSRALAVLSRIIRSALKCYISYLVICASFSFVIILLQNGCIISVVSKTYITIRKLAVIYLFHLIERPNWIKLINYKLVGKVFATLETPYDSTSYSETPALSWFPISRICLLQAIIWFRNTLYTVCRHPAGVSRDRLFSVRYVPSLAHRWPSTVSSNI